VHRPTAARPVEAAPLGLFRIAQIRRPRTAKPPAPSRWCKVYQHEGGAKAFRNGVPSNRMEVRILWDKGVKVWVDGKPLDPASVKVEIQY
jgi:hypothetical protein